jgi:hypothetical protein
MPDQPELRYEIILNFPGEPRISEHRPNDFEAAVEYALQFARKNRGVRVQVNLSIPRSAVHQHSYVLFVCEYPELHPFMQRAIEQHYGRQPE